MSFDQFAPPGGAIDPFAPVSALSSDIVGSAPNPLDMNVSMSDFFSPPLPFDNEILQSMQSLTNQNVWQDVALPGMFKPFV